MKVVTILFAAFFMALSFRVVFAQEVRMHSNAACHQLELGAPAQIKIERSGNKIIVHVLSLFGCGESPSEPKIGVHLHAATLSVQSYAAPSQPLAACLCSQDITFEVSGLPEGIEDIYYVQDGLVYGYIKAP